MAEAVTQQVLDIAPTLYRLRHLWVDYDEKADVLYVSFRRPQNADDSELTEDDLIVRYSGDEVVGLTILHARSRFEPA